MKVMLGVPCYGGNLHACCASSIIALYDKTRRAGHSLSTYWVWNESLIQRARNNALSSFLSSDADVLFFIDSDVEFSPQKATHMLEDAHYFSTSEGLSRLHGHVVPPIVGGSYPSKRIDPDSFADGVALGMAPAEALATSAKQTIYADIKSSADMVNAVYTDTSTYFEVEHLPTGLMAISRRAALAYLELVKPARYQQDGELRADWFACDVAEVGEAKTPTLLSEDYSFCRRYIDKAGGKVLVCTDLIGAHYGSMMFGKKPGA